jgi:BMFP domain-containing protein YqiC
MADRSSSDKGLKDIVKQVYDMWEKGATEQFVKIARNQVFLAAMAQNLEKTLNISGRVKDITQTTMTMMNLPTRQDFDALKKELKNVRAALDEINDKLDALVPAPAAGSKSKAKKARKAKSE